MAPASLPVSTSRMHATPRSYNPGHAVTCPVWAVPLSLATTQGITVVFSSCAYLDVSVRRVRVCIRRTFSTPGCPIRKPPDRFAFADPRRLSQLVASFIASGSLGIPRVPLSTFFPPRPFCKPRKCFPCMHEARTGCCLLYLLVFFQYVKELLSQSKK